MVFILAASSLDHVSATLTPEEGDQQKKFDDLGPELEPKYKKSSKNCSKLACKGSQREKKDLVI